MMKERASSAVAIAFQIKQFKKTIVKIDILRLHVVYRLGN